MQIPHRDYELIQHVDATPDNDYPIRILEAYLVNNQSQFETHGLDENATKFWAQMNEIQTQRVEILQEAINILKRNLK